jgi:N12 class adenine-specific DNA methylase
MGRLVRPSRASPSKQFKGRPLTSQAIDLARQAKLIAPVVATTPSEKRLQELWRQHPNRFDYEGVDTPGGKLSKRAPLTKTPASHLRPGDMYVDATEGLVRIKRVSPIDPKHPSTIVVTTSKGAKSLPVNKPLYVSRPEPTLLAATPGEEPRPQGWQASETPHTTFKPSGKVDPIATIMAPETHLGKPLAAGSTVEKVGGVDFVFTPLISPKPVQAAEAVTPKPIVAYQDRNAGAGWYRVFGAFPADAIPDRWEAVDSKLETIYQAWLKKPGAKGKTHQSAVEWQRVARDPAASLAAEQGRVAKIAEADLEWKAQEAKRQIDRESGKFGISAEAAGTLKPGQRILVVGDDKPWTVTEVAGGEVYARSATDPEGQAGGYIPNANISLPAETAKQREDRMFHETEVKFADEAASTETIPERERRRKIAAASIGQDILASVHANALKAEQELAESKRVAATWEPTTEAVARGKALQAASQEITAAKPRFGYIGLYKGKQYEVYANSTYEAQKKIAAEHHIKDSGNIDVMLAEKDGQPVIHSTTELEEGRVQKEEHHAEPTQPSISPESHLVPADTGRVGGQSAVLPEVMPEERVHGSEEGGRTSGMGISEGEVSPRLRREPDIIGGTAGDRLGQSHPLTDTGIAGRVAVLEQPIVKAPAKEPDARSFPIQAGGLQPGDTYFDVTYGTLVVEKVYPVNPKYPKGIEVETNRGRRQFDPEAIMYIDRPPTTKGIEILPPLPEAKPLIPTVAPRKDTVLTSDDDVGAGMNPPAHFEANLDAIRIVKKLEEEKREATPEEQATLAKYSGFGDSAYNDAFETSSWRKEKLGAWGRRGDQLRELLTPDEYQALERSRLNAFYTTPDVIRATWAGLQQMGTDKIAHPHVLEPSAGSGRFLGFQPEEMAKRSTRTAIELDTLTGAMLKHAYPNTKVYITGYQNTPLPDDSVDIAISNVPFGDYPINDPAFRKGRALQARQIHNYFFAKTLDKLRPGGVLAFVTSHGTLDAPTSEPIRQALADRADLVGAIRLPKTAFPDTEVVTDIVFMRKRLPGETVGDQSWVKSEAVEMSTGGEYSYKRTVHINQYFQEHPEMVLGTHSAAGSMYRGGEYTVEPKTDRSLNAQIIEATQRLPANVVLDTPEQAMWGNAPIRTPLSVPNGTHVLDDNGNVLEKAGGVLVKAQYPGTQTPLTTEDQQRVKDLMRIRDASRDVLNIQLREGTPTELAEAQKHLQEEYDSFVTQHGYLNTPHNANLMEEDPDGPFLRAMENWDDNAAKKLKNPALREKLTEEQIDLLEAQLKLGKAEAIPGEAVNLFKMPIFTQTVVRGLGEHTAESPSDALAITLNEKGRLDFDRMGQMLGKTPEEVRTSLYEQKQVYKNPAGDWETADKYLSGDVRQKLRDAQAAAGADPFYSANVTALDAIQPADIPPSQIDVRLGAHWVSAEDVNEFTKDLLGVYGYGYRSGGRNPQFFRYVPATGEWVRETKIQGDNAKMTSEWGTSRMPADVIIERVLNSKPIEVSDKTEGDKTERNPQETLAAQEKAAAIQAQFSKWLWEDAERSKRIQDTYNNTFNNLRPQRYDGSHLVFPGMSTKWAKWMRPHQKDATWRVIQDGTALYAHDVGFGKTAPMVASGMELRRLGLSRKNLYVVPKATHAQFRDQFKDIYPYSKVLYPGEEDFTPAKRTEFLSRAVTGDWDAIIVSDSQFRRIPIKPETEGRFLRQEMDNFRAALEIEEEAMREASGGRHSKESKSHKELQKALIKMEARLIETQAKVAEKTEHTINFEDMGVDQMFVDEADMYKNLRFATRMGRVKGLPNTDSERAWDLYQKVRVLQEKGGGRGVVFATGTPIANTVAEMYTQMRYLQEPELEKRGLQHFDAWAKTFGETTDSIEQTPTGAYRSTQRFAKFTNVPELSNLWQGTADIRVASEEPTIVRERPRLVDEAGKEGQRTVIAIPPDQALLDYMKSLAVRADQLGSVDPREDNMLKISNDARKASLDMRLVDAYAPVNAGGKIATASRKIAEVYRETTPDKGTQLVFLDLGTPKAIDKPSEEAAALEGQDLSTEVAGEGEEKLLTDVYSNIKANLIASGIPASEIAFIHDAKNDRQRTILLEKVNTGDVRVLIGSTGKMGVGVNVQKRAAALHHLDAPWRPRDIEQREGRAIRQGNEVYGPKKNTEGKIIDPGKGVRVYSYVTERSFDAFMWQAIEAKSKAIRSVMRREPPTARNVEDIDSLTMSAAEAKAIASGNPDVMKSVTLKNEIAKLQLLNASHFDAHMRAQEQIRTLPTQVANLKDIVVRMQHDAALAQASTDAPFALSVAGQTYGERPAAGEALVGATKNAKSGEIIGAYRGFQVKVVDTGPSGGYKYVLVNPATGQEHSTSTIGYQEITPAGAVQRVHNKVNGIPETLTQTQQKLEQAEASLKTYRERLDTPFAHKARLGEMQTELRGLERKLQAPIPAEAVR